MAAPRVFLWRQPFRWRSEPDHLPASARRAGAASSSFTASSAIAVCGIGGCAGLRQPTFPVVAVSLEPVFGSIDDYRQTIADAVRRLEQATGLAPVIVAHSMGGLAARAWLAAQPEAPLASPRDDRLAARRHAARRRTAEARTSRQMRLGSDWLARLAASEAAGVASALHLLLEPLRQHRLPDPQRDACGRRQPSSAGDAARADGRAPGGVRRGASDRRDDALDRPTDAIAVTSAAPRRDRLGRLHVRGRRGRRRTSRRRSP